MTFNVNVFTSGATASSDDINANFTGIGSILNGEGSTTNYMVPIGTILPWLKTFNLKATGTNTTETTGSLIDSAADFSGSGTEVEMIIENSDDNTFTDIKDLNLDTEFSVGSHAFAGTGINYNIWATPKLPDNFVECNGNAISDGNSPYNGSVSPDLNGDSINRFLRGAGSSGDLGGTETHQHSVSQLVRADNAGGLGFASDAATSFSGTLPSYYSIVWIMRIK